MKLEEQIKAIKLRKKGLPYSDILKRVGVSKSTLSLWLRDIWLTPAQEIKLLKGRELSRHKAVIAKRQKRVNITKKITKEGEKELLNLVNNPLFIVGLALYWAEGDKHKGERVKFTNSDERMIKLMMRWFREICFVPEEKFRIALHVHSLHTKSDIKNYWSKITGVSEARFQKLYIKQTSLRQRRNILYNGTCGIVINNKNLFRRMLGWKIGLIRYFKI